MLEKIESIIFQFRNCFAREASFNWFVIIILGFIIRFDHHGVSSFIRWFFMDPKWYDPMLCFFRADSWSLLPLITQWITLVIAHCPIPEIGERIILIGDAIKVSKEAKKMPGVKRLHQDSENSGKGEYIFGHHFNFVGILTGGFKKMFCLPLCAEINEGIDGLRDDQGIGRHPSSIVTRMARLIIRTALATGRNCYVVLDAYYATGPMFMILQTVANEKKEQIVHVITRAKMNYVGYFDCEFAQTRFHKNDKFHLTDWFDAPELFETVTLNFFGKVKTVECYCNNYLWKPVNDYVRFVFICDGNEQYILMCSDLMLSARHIITIYLIRSKIETMFLFLKHIIGGFKYHFWTKFFPESQDNTSPEFASLPDLQKQKIRQTVDAIERFVNLAGISMGLLHYLALNYSSEIWEKYAGWIRTQSSDIPSEEVVQNVIQLEFYSFDGKVHKNRTLEILWDKRRKSLKNHPPSYRDAG